MSDDPIEAIARATLYEGHVLWPYRRSALKNRQPFTFGDVYPGGFCRATEQQDRSAIRCECLLEGEADASIDVELRFLHRVHRQVLQRNGSADCQVDALEADSELHLTWTEAAERRAPAGAGTMRALEGAPVGRTIRVPAGEHREPIRDRHGALAGWLHRTWEDLDATATTSVARLGRGTWRVTIDVANASAWTGRDRSEARRRTLTSTHLVLGTAGGAFVSATDPPDRLAEASTRCRRDGVWPVLVGEPGQRDRMLASPIIMDDHPRVAPESPGDFFDGGEIDQLLVLNILTLTDDEKREMAATDPRAREILRRTEALSREQLRQLHGTFRDPPRRRP